jgi:hypothetical protein
MSIQQHESHGSRAIYQDLVQLTFLVGRGMPLEELLTKFLSAMRPRIPARGLWLFRGSQLMASDAEPDTAAPAAPATVPPTHQVQIGADDPLLGQICVMPPSMVLVVRFTGDRVERAGDIMLLCSRLLALAWQCEQFSQLEPIFDDYQLSKMQFKRRFLQRLLNRYRGNVSAASAAAKLSRAALYKMLEQCGMTVDRSLERELAGVPRPDLRKDGDASGSSVILPRV